MRPFGIIGDAFGTAIPLACSTIFFMPRHVSRLLSIRLTTYLREAYVLPFLLTAASRRDTSTDATVVRPAQLSRTGTTALDRRRGLWRSACCGRYLSNRALSTGVLVVKNESKPDEIKVIADPVETYQQDV